MKTNEIILAAFANGELVNVLKGTDGYAIEFDQWLGAVAPTDWTRVLPLFYDYSTKIGEENASLMLDDAIITLLCGSSEDVYIGISVLYTQILREENNRSPISINRDKLLNIASAKIIENEHGLRAIKKWQAVNDSEGLLSEVKRYQRLLKSKFNLVI